MNTNAITGPNLSNYRIVNERVCRCVDAWPLVPRPFAFDDEPITKNRDSTVVHVPGEGTKYTGTCPDCGIERSVVRHDRCGDTNQASPDPSDWRKACRVVKMPDGDWDVVSEDGRFWLEGRSSFSWIAYERTDDGVNIGWHETRDDAERALSSCPTPPPGWKETTCLTSSKPPSNGAASPKVTERMMQVPHQSMTGSSRTSGGTCDCGKVEHGRHHTLCPASGVKYSDKEDKTKSPALRPASEVASDITDAVLIVGRANDAPAVPLITADRVAVLEWMHKRFFAKGLAYAGEAINKAIEELKGTPR